MFLSPSSLTCSSKLLLGYQPNCLRLRQRNVNRHTDKSQAFVSYIAIVFCTLDIVFGH